MMISRRIALLAPFALVASTGLGHAAPVSLRALSDYLNAMTTAEAEFTQVNSDGTVSTGRIIIRRPGRVRFEYASPDRTLVLASSGTVAIFDGKSNQPPEQYPLSKTPLSLILAANIDLTRARMVTGHRDDGTSTRVTAQDPEHPEYGNIELVFTDNPLELRQWVITDDLGQTTTVILGTLKRGGSYGANLFSIEVERERRR